MAYRDQFYNLLISTDSMLIKIFLTDFSIMNNAKFILYRIKKEVE
jgi:hypothetical protein